MSTLALQCNDAGILARGLSPGTAPYPEPSPGFALLDGAELRVGARAREQSRLKPRFVHNRFWDRLDSSPLSRPFPTELSHADLVHAHLAEIWERVKPGVDGVLLALPGWWSESQLGLILGIARSCGIPVAGMVDSAVASSSRGHPGEHLLHLDIQLHRVVVTELGRGRELVRRRVETSDHTGVVALHDRWVRTIAEAFVTQTRFDPLHVAATEQALYDRLHEVLALLCDAPSATVRMEDAAGRTHRVELEAQRLVSAAAEPYDGIVELVRLLKHVGRHSTLLLSHRVGRLPGLSARIAEVGDTEIVILPEGAAAEGALRHAEILRTTGEAMPFVTRLPVEGGVRGRGPATAGPPETAPGPARRRGRAPTHLLHDSGAYAITAEPLVLGVAVPEERRGIRLTGATAGISRSHCSVYREAGRIVVQDHSTHGSFLNGQRIDGTADLAAGDRLRLGSPGIELLLIRVVDDDGASQG